MKIDPNEDITMHLWATHSSVTEWINVEQIGKVNDSLIH